MRNIGNKTKKKLGRKSAAESGEMERLSTFCKLTSVVASTLDLEKVLDVITRSACQLTKTQACTLRLLDKEKDELVPVSSYGLNLEYKKKGPVKAGESIAGLVLKEKKSRAVIDVEKDPCYKRSSFAKKAGLKSLLCTPLVLKDEVVGVLSVYTTKPYRFKEREEKILTLFANEATIAIENAKLINRIQGAYLNTLKALGAIVDAFDWHTERHSEKVREYAMSIAREMDLPEDDLHAIEYAALIHDVGKIGVDLNILRKPGSLNNDEWKEIVKHPVLGANIANKIDIFSSLVPLIMHHHEKYGGGGYPDGLKKESIPLGARVLSVADAYDAMTAERPYKKAMTKDEAIEEIKKNSGTQFDPKVVDAFLKIVRHLSPAQ